MSRWFADRQASDDNVMSVRLLPLLLCTRSPSTTWHIFHGTGDSRMRVYYNLAMST